MQAGTLEDGGGALICCKDLGMEKKHLYERRELVLAASFGKEAIDGLQIAQE